MKGPWPLSHEVGWADSTEGARFVSTKFGSMHALQNNRACGLGLLTVGSLFFSLSLSAQFVPTPIAPMMDYRQAHAMAPVMGGMLAIGGFDGGATTASCEWYDPATDVWTSVSSLPEPRQDATAHATASGVYVIGGWNGGATNFNDILRYDEAADEWAVVANMSEGRSGHASVVTPDGILICGGYDGSSDLASCDLFDPNSYDVTPVADMGMARSSFAMMHFNHEGIPHTLVAGGFNPDAGFQLASCELFDGTAWGAAADLPWGVDNLAGAVFDGASPVVAGGRVYNGAANLFEGIAQGAVYDAGSDAWAVFDLAAPHSYHGMAVTPDSRVWISGGVNETGSGVSTTHTFAEQGQLGVAPFASVMEPAECAGRFRAAVADDGEWLVVTGGDASSIGTGYRVALGGASAVSEGGASDLTVFPNPAVGRTVLMGVGPATLWTAFDANGRPVLEGRGPEVDLTGFADGRYTVVLSDGQTAAIILQ